jgi:hypothetical protein
MYPQPRFLQQVVSLSPARHLALEESKQSGAKSANQSCWRIWIGLLVALHPAVQVYKRLPWRHSLLETRPHLHIIRGGNRRSYVLEVHFFGAKRSNLQFFRDVSNRIGNFVVVMIRAPNASESLFRYVSYSRTTVSAAGIRSCLGRNPYPAGDKLLSSRLATVRRAKRYVCSLQTFYRALDRKTRYVPKGCKRKGSGANPGEGRASHLLKPRPPTPQVWSRLADLLVWGPAV